VTARIVVVGGGIAGLAASIYLARQGRPVTLFERRRDLGGRAVTHIRQGFRFNLGPHAIARGGAAWSVYRELGIPARGGHPAISGLALLNGSRYRLPVGLFSVLTSSLLDGKGKVEAAGFLLRLGRMKPSLYASMTVRQWLDGNIRNERLRQVIESYIRLATYSAAAGEQSAGHALARLQLVSRGTVYLNEGWQKIVDALHSHAVAAGVRFVTSSHVVRVVHDDAVSGIEIGELEISNRRDTRSIALPESADLRESGARILATAVLLAVSPLAARTMTSGLDWPEMKPVTAACLDVALSKLPEPRQTFAIGIDRPLYYSVHSRWAQLTPRGGALVHVAKYRSDGVAAADDELDSSGRGSVASDDERELEALLDDLQPGWREVVVHRRFLPSMTVSNALVTPQAKRPDVRTPVRGLYLAGDWVGDDGLLSDAALASARAAAKAILADT
jgi:phytoene dehydrogenase-like protein